jgi:hypothetical protein
MTNSSDTRASAPFAATAHAVTLPLTARLWLCVAASRAGNPIIQTRFTADPAPKVYHHG